VNECSRKVIRNTANPKAAFTVEVCDA
jgi:hypothetical protein